MSKKKVFGSDYDCANCGGECVVPTTMACPDCSDESTPTVGMGATLYHVSDRYAYTVTHVLSANSILARKDLDLGATGYKISTMEDEVFTRRKDGSWRRVGSSVNHLPRLRLGKRTSYRDPSF